MIELKNVSKTYGNGTHALKDVSLKVEPGEFVFVVGASGAGKSTFLKLLLREEVPSSGSVTVNGYDLVHIPSKEIPFFRRTLGIVFQDFRLIHKMTVFDNVAFAMRVIGAKEKEIRKRVPYVLSLVGLASKARCLPEELSGGEQQRVALARALVNNAALIIADEPTGNIDPEMSFEIVDLLNHINAAGTTVIMVTHEHELVRQFNHRVIVIENGSVVSDAKNNEGLDYSGENARRLHAVNERAKREAQSGSGKGSSYYAYDDIAKTAEFVTAYSAAEAKPEEKSEENKAETASSMPQVKRAENSEAPKAAAEGTSAEPAPEHSEEKTERESTEKKGSERLGDLFLKDYSFYFSDETGGDGQ